MTGNYEATFSAQNCIKSDRPLLPIELRTHTFPVRVAQTGADIWVTENVPGNSSLDAVADVLLWGAVDSDGHVALTNYHGNDQWDTLSHQVTPDRAVMILVERMRVATSSEGLLTVGKFAGYFESRLNKTVIESDCLSTSHSVTFMRRESSQ